MSDNTDFAAELGGKQETNLFGSFLQDLSIRMDKRFDRFDERFDGISSDLKTLDVRLARVEASDVAARVTSLEKDSHRASNRLTKIETLFLPITALGGALVAGLGTWAVGLLPSLTPHT